MELFGNSLDNSPSSIIFYLEMKGEVKVGVHDIRSRFTPRLKSIIISPQSFLFAWQAICQLPTSLRDSWLNWTTCNSPILNVCPQDFKGPTPTLSTGTYKLQIVKIRMQKNLRLQPLSLTDFLFSSEMQGSFEIHRGLHLLGAPLLAFDPLKIKYLLYYSIQFNIYLLFNIKNIQIILNQLYRINK